MQQRRFSGVGVALVWVLFGAGCATNGYLAARGRDAADVFTLTVGTGAGVKGRVGPVQVALIENADLAGLRAGAFFADGDGLVVNDEIYAPIPIYTVLPDWLRRGGRGVRTGTTARSRRRALQARTEPVALQGLREKALEGRWITSRSRWTRLFGEEAFSHGLNSLSARRNKNQLAKSPLPVACIGATAPHYTHVELAGGFLFTLRAGFNIGELLDFLAGWGGADLYGDDEPRPGSSSSRTASPMRR